MRMSTQTWPNFEIKAVSSNTKPLQSALLQSVLNAHSGGNSSLCLKGLLVWMKKTHQSPPNCIAVIKTVISRLYLMCEVSFGCPSPEWLPRAAGRM